MTILCDFEPASIVGLLIVLNLKQVIKFCGRQITFQQFVTLPLPQHRFHFSDENKERRHTMSACMEKTSYFGVNLNGTVQASEFCSGQRKYLPMYYLFPNTTRISENFRTI